MKTVLKLGILSLMLLSFTACSALLEELQRSPIQKNNGMPDATGTVYVN